MYIRPSVVPGVRHFDSPAKIETAATAHKGLFAPFLLIEGRTFPISSMRFDGSKGVNYGGVTVSTGSFAARRHAGVWAPIIACKTKVANDNLALAA
jgi:hypothetical protein